MPTTATSLPLDRRRRPRHALLLLTVAIALAGSGACESRASRPLTGLPHDPPLPLAAAAERNPVATAAPKPRVCGTPAF